MLPFTHDQFVAVFAAYNHAVWPAQVAAYVLALAVCAALAWQPRRAPALVAAALATMWAWTGVAYHITFFARINPAAYAFGALFVAQAALFALPAFTRKLEPRAGHGPRAWLAWALIAYAMVLYPLAGIATGASYPGLPMFGITPCPLTLFTFGVLLLSGAAVPWWMLLIPLAWSLVGGSAAFLLSVPQDWPLLFSGLAVLAISLLHRPAGARKNHLRS